MTTEITTSHDLSDWREAFETTEPGPELDRIRSRVAAARQRGENDALVAVVLDEASGWRERALHAEEKVDAVWELVSEWDRLDPGLDAHMVRWDYCTELRDVLRGDS